MENKRQEKGINRRSFIFSTAAAGAGLVFGPKVFGQAAAAAGAGDINVALIGAGAQGKVLLNACLNIPGVRFKAVCDIWESFGLKPAVKLLEAYKHSPIGYTDYREMLATEKGLDAAIIATPDFMHAEHACACLEAGLNVYCEKEMSNTLEGARKMVETARKTGKLLQIGHQRRSNPIYLYSCEKILNDAHLIGKITTINGQWNRSTAACQDIAVPKKYIIDEAVLKKYGYESMEQFRNWRWYKGMGGGPIVDLGSHQIDIYSWFLGANPKSVIASGGIDYWNGRQWYDNVMAIYEYVTPAGTVRALYQTLTTNSSNGYFESFLGDKGTLLVSEAPNRTSVYREAWVPEQEWDVWVKKGYVTKKAAPVKEKSDLADVRESETPPQYYLNVEMNKPAHQPHLENFFEAVRSGGKVKLNCPAEVGYETAVTVLKVNEAVEACRKLDFKPEEFKV